MKVESGFADNLMQAEREIKERSVYYSLSTCDHRNLLFQERRGSGKNMSSLRSWVSTEVAVVTRVWSSGERSGLEMDV